MRHPNHRTRRAGFTLTEVLISLGIFALGAVAVASIFPSAILIQKRTIQDVEAETFEAAIRAELLGRGFLEDDLLAGGYPDPPAGDPPLVLAKTPAVQTNTDARWPLRARSYGSLAEDAVDRGMFWKPLFLDSNPLQTSSTSADQRDWSVFVFIVRPATVGEYPKSLVDSGVIALDNPQDPDSVPKVGRIDARYDVVSGTPTRYAFTIDNDRDGLRIIRTGDKVLDARGRIHRVLDASDTQVFVAGPVDGLSDGNAINLWYADPGTAREASFVELLRLDDADGPSSHLVHPKLTP